MPGIKGDKVESEDDNYKNRDSANDWRGADRFNGITLFETALFWQKQSNDLQKLQSRMLILLGILLLTCFTSLLDWMECGSSSCRPTCNWTDWWRRVADVQFSCTNVN